MRIERSFVDGNGKNFRVTITIEEDGPALDRAIHRLAIKARRARAGSVTALDGAVRVSVQEET